MKTRYRTRRRSYSQKKCKKFQLPNDKITRQQNVEIITVFLDARIFFFLLKKIMKKRRTAPERSHSLKKGEKFQLPYNKITR